MLTGPAKQEGEKNNMPRDTYREWGPSERTDAWLNGDREGCYQYDRYFESSDRAYENYRNGGDFTDTNTDGRFH